TFVVRNGNRRIGDPARRLDLVQNGRAKKTVDEKERDDDYMRQREEKKTLDEISKSEMVAATCANAHDRHVTSTIVLGHLHSHTPSHFISAFSIKFSPSPSFFFFETLVELF